MAVIAIDNRQYYRQTSKIFLKILYLSASYMAMG